MQSYFWTFIIGLVLIIISSVTALLKRDKEDSNLISNILFSAGSAAVLSFCILYVFIDRYKIIQYNSEVPLFTPARIILRFDTGSVVMLAVFSFIAILVSIMSIKYNKMLFDTNSAYKFNFIKGFAAPAGFLLLVSNNFILTIFLIQIILLLIFLFVCMDFANSKNGKRGLTYLIYSQIGIASLTAGLLLLTSKSGVVNSEGYIVNIIPNIYTIISSVLIIVGFVFIIGLFPCSNKLFEISESLPLNVKLFLYSFINKIFLFVMIKNMSLIFESDSNIFVLLGLGIVCLLTIVLSLKQFITNRLVYKQATYAEIIGNAVVVAFFTLGLYAGYAGFVSIADSFFGASMFILITQALSIAVICIASDFCELYSFGKIFDNILNLSVISLLMLPPFSGFPAIFAAFESIVRYIKTGDVLRIIILLFTIVIGALLLLAYLACILSLHKNILRTNSDTRLDSSIKPIHRIYTYISAGFIFASAFIGLVPFGARFMLPEEIAVGYERLRLPVITSAIIILAILMYFLFKNTAYRNRIIQPVHTDEVAEITETSDAELTEELLDIPVNVNKEDNTTPDSPEDDLVDVEPIKAENIESEDGNIYGSFIYESDDSEPKEDSDK